MDSQVLDVWARVWVVALGLSVVLTTVVIVVCLVKPGCWLNTIFVSKERRGKPKKEWNEKGSLFSSDPQMISYKATDKVSVNAHHTPNLPKSTEDRKITPPHKNELQQTGDANSLLGPLSTKRDSTYSSMSENSGRTSPTNSCRSSVEGSYWSGVVSNTGSPTGGEAQGQISFTIQFSLTSAERGTGKLIVTVIEARGLPGRQFMGGACDPYVKVVVWKERRSLRKQKCPPLYTYQTRTVRHTADPSFKESFSMEVNKNDLKDLTVKLVAMDSNKWVSPTTLGEVIQPLREIKSLTTKSEKTFLNFFLGPAKLDYGEILFGLSYLPTAQRLSVSVIKAYHLKYSKVVDDIADFCPYVRVLLISPSGRVIDKKKTTFRSNTDKPLWNETLIFNMPQNMVENVTFLLAVCSRPRTPSNALVAEAVINSEIEDALLLSPHSTRGSSTGSSPAHEGVRRHDKYVGNIFLGCQVGGEEERRHWISVLAAPRKVISLWHSLK